MDIKIIMLLRGEVLSVSRWELPGQEQGGVDEPESIQFDESEEAASDLEGESQPTTSRVKPATSTTQVFWRNFFYKLCLV